MSSRDHPFSQLNPYQQAVVISIRTQQLSVQGHSLVKLTELPEKGNATSDIDVARKELTTGRARVSVRTASVSAAR